MNQISEIIGAWYAIKTTVLRLGASKLWLEEDALGVIHHAIQKGTIMNGYIAELFCDI